MFVHYLTKFAQVQVEKHRRDRFFSSFFFANNFLHVFLVMFFLVHCGAKIGQNKLSDLLLTFPRALNEARA